METKSFSKEQNGMIFGVGIGIGDPEDVTLKAINVIKRSDVLILPKKDKSKCRSYMIVKEVMPEIDEKETLALEFEMTKDDAVSDRNHKEIYETAKDLVLKGKNVTFLTIGDPALYSTYSYIAKLAKQDGINTQSISGISSITACANRLGITLCEKDEQLHVIPDTSDIEVALKYHGTKVFMKCGRNITRLREALKDKPVSVYAVSDCGMPGEKLYRGVEQLPDDDNYMLTVIVKEKRETLDRVQA